MAFEGKLPTFNEGQVVFCAVPNKLGLYRVRRSEVQKVFRGVVTLKDEDGEIFNCGLSSRRLSYTFGECGFVCALLNNRPKTNKSNERRIIEI